MVSYIAFITDEPGGFAVVFPDLPGCCSVGDSFDHAVEMAHEALSLYADAVQAGGRTLPPPRRLATLQATPPDWIEPGYVPVAITLRS